MRITFSWPFIVKTRSRKRYSDYSKNVLESSLPSSIHGLHYYLFVYCSKKSFGRYKCDKVRQNPLHKNIWATLGNFANFSNRNFSQKESSHNDGILSTLNLWRSFCLEKCTISRSGFEFQEMAGKILLHFHSFLRGIVCLLQDRFIGDIHFMRNPQRFRECKSSSQSWLNGPTLILSASKCFNKLLKS